MNAGPSAVSRIADDAVDSWDAHVCQVLALKSRRIADRAVSQCRGQLPHLPQIAQIKGQAEDVNSRHSVVPAVENAVVARDHSPRKARRCLGRVLDILSYLLNSLERLAARPGCRDNRQVRSQGPGVKELVNQPLYGAQTDAAVVKLAVSPDPTRLGLVPGTLSYLLAPVISTKSWSLAGTASHGAVAGTAVLEPMSCL